MAAGARRYTYGEPPTAGWRRKPGALEVAEVPQPAEADLRVGRVESVAIAVAANP